MSRILITGAAGFLGEAVVNASQKRGFDVRLWTHQKHSNETKQDCVHGSIQDVVLADTATKDVEIVVHLAARKSDEGDSVDVNVDGTRILAESARRNGVKHFVYVSTQSVKLQERGLYAETKLQGEEAARSAFPETLIVRPSLIYGDALEGLMLTLARVSALPIVPVFGSGASLFQPIHRDDLAEGLLTLAENESLHGHTLDVGGKEEVTFIALLRLFQSIREIKRPILTFPMWVGLMIASCLQWMKKPPITKSNVRGGSEIVSMDLQVFREKGQPPTRPLRYALDSAWRSYKREEEPRLLLRYIGATPRPELEYRYRAACQKHGLLELLRTSALLLPLQDMWTKLYTPSSLFRKKLLVAAAVYECDTASAETLLPKERSIVGVLVASIGIGLLFLVIVICSQALFLFPSRVRHGA